MIAAANTFIRIMQFRFGEHYDSYLDAETENDQMLLVDDKDKDTCVHLWSSEWQDLKVTKGRKVGACLILAMLRYGQQQRSQGVNMNAD